MGGAVGRWSREVMKVEKYLKYAEIDELEIAGRLFRRVVVICPGAGHGRILRFSARVWNWFILPTRHGVQYPIAIISILFKRNCVLFGRTHQPPSCDHRDWFQKTKTPHQLTSFISCPASLGGLFKDLLEEEN